MSTVTNTELMQDLARGPKQNIFGSKDHSIVRAALQKLSEVEQEVVLLRFWEQNAISEIAKILDLTWEEAERHLASALQKLKTLCLGNTGFSRSSAVVPNSPQVKVLKCAAA